jgi:sterol desaturase/sphingolipid hydroxylase (fatty acid hydroxylase superfamily)
MYEMRIGCVLSAIVARVAYPGVVLASAALAHALFVRAIPAGLAVSAAFLAALLLVHGLERRLPLEPRWNPPAAELRQDASYLGLAALLQPAGRLIGHAGVTVLALAGGELLGVRDPALPAWSSIALAVLLADLGKYALHRLAHAWGWLFRFHAEHHSPGRMHAFNGVRLHPVNLLWNLALDAALPLAFGLEPYAIVMIASVRGAVSVLQHANVRLHVGPLRWLLSTPDLHQWHHARDLGQAHANYGSMLIVWDVIFGTRRLPPGRPQALGLADDDVRPASLFHQLVWPWCATKATTCRALRGWSPAPPAP